MENEREKRISSKSENKCMKKTHDLGKIKAVKQV